MGIKHITQLLKTYFEGKSTSLERASPPLLKKGNSPVIMPILTTDAVTENRQIYNHNDLKTS